jgi:hypothetical protein
LEDGEQNPIHFEDCAFPITNISCVDKIAFATADNPFYKPERCKYFPEILIVDKEANVLAKMNPHSSEQEVKEFGLQFADDFRD